MFTNVAMKLIVERATSICSIKSRTVVCNQRVAGYDPSKDACCICNNTFQIVAYFPKVGSCDLLPVCVCFVSPPISFWMPEPIFMKLDTYMTAPESIPMVYFINPSHQSVCLYVYVAGQRLNKNVTAATNTHATIEEFLDASSSIRSMSYQMKVDA
jgi:hypothetical protein